MSQPLQLTFFLEMTGTAQRQPDSSISLPAQTFMSADSALQTIRGVLNFNAKLPQPYQSLRITAGAESSPSILCSTVILSTSEHDKAEHALATLLRGGTLPHDHAISVLQEFVEDVDSCGGLYALEWQGYSPKGAPSWFDLGMTAHKAEEVLVAANCPVTLQKEAFDGSIDDLLTTSASDKHEQTLTDFTPADLKQLTGIPPRNAGQFLADFLARNHISEEQAALQLGCDMPELSKLLKGGALTPKMAVKAHLSFGLSVQMLFNFEYEYNMHQADSYLMQQKA